jgi:hypothetical protein
MQLEAPRTGGLEQVQLCPGGTRAALWRVAYSIPLEALHAPEEGVRYILIDALDESLARPQKGQNIVGVLASRLNRLPGWLRLVATTRKEPDILERLRGL